MLTRPPAQPKMPPSWLGAMIGKTLGRYHILEKIGAGGMGEVYRAHDKQLDRNVVLKFLPERFLQDTKAIARFAREARAASALNHPNIVTVHEIGQVGATRFIVMELVEGCTLRSLMGERPSLKLLAEIIAQVAKALTAAHAARIIHQDIKPENIMLRADGYAKVLDFGLARSTQPVTHSLSETTQLTASGTLVGTVNYMSPEQVRGEELDNATDIFSLGTVFYELATGRLPFVADSPISVLHAIVSQVPLPPSQLNPEISTSLEALVLRMLQKHPRLRPTAAEVEAALTGRLVPREVGERAPPPRHHIVGREKELGELRAGFDSAAAGRGLLLCLSGEPGIGKTALIEQFLTELTKSGKPSYIARGRCSERLAGTEAYLPFLEALESLLRGHAQEGMARFIQALAPTWYAQITPFDRAPGPTLAETRAASQERLKRELVTCLQEICRFRPFILFFDDLHWADMSTTDLLAYLAAKMESMQLLVLATYRPSELLLGKHPFVQVKLDLQAHGICREIEIPFLARDHIASYLALEFPSHRFPADFAAFIHSKTEGSPLFMVDLLRYLRDRQIIAEEQGSWLLAQAVPRLERELPESVRSMVQRKIDQLSDQDRDLLVAASVQGYELDSAVAAKTLSLDHSQVEERLEVLDRVHALVAALGEWEFPDGTVTLRYRFVHLLYQNALYASLMPTRRVALSAAVANGLLGFYGEHSASVAAELAFLFETARDFARASDYFLLATQNAARAFAYQEAILLTRKGLEVTNRLREGPERALKELALETTLGGLPIVTKGRADPEVEIAYARARELCGQVEDSPHLFTALRGLSEFYHTRRGELETARQLAEQALLLAERLQDTTLIVDAHHAVSMPLIYLGELTLAQEHLKQGIALYRPEQHRLYTDLYPDIDHGVGCQFQMARASWLLGYPDQALRHSYEGIVLAEKLAHPISLAWIHALAGLIHGFRREAQKTQEQADAAISLCRDYGFEEPLGWATAWLGWARAKQGNSKEGIDQIREGLALNPHHSLRPHVLALLAEVLADAHRVEEGLTVLAEALETVRTGGRYYHSELCHLKGTLLLMQSETNAMEAQGCLHEGLQIARRQNARALELRAAVSLGRLYQKQGKNEDARGILTPIYGWFTEGLETADLTEAKALLEQISSG